jgi:hypothetical protein
VKKKNEPVKAKTKKQEVQIEDSFLYLKGELLWKYRAVDAEYRNFMLALNMKKQEVQNEFDKHPELAKLIRERDYLLSQASIHAKEVQEVNMQIEKELKVELKNCSIDDKTGRIFVLDNGVEVAPKQKEVQKESLKKKGKTLAA